MGQITELMCESYDIAVTHGYFAPGHELSGVETLAFLMQVSSEVGETAKCVELGQWTGSENRVPTGVGIEMADIVLRTMSLCHALGIDLEAMVILKMRHNAIRARMQGRQK